MDIYKSLSKGETGKLILKMLSDVKDTIADCRSGSWSTEARKSAIEAIDNTCYNKIKSYRENPDQKDDYFDSMI